MTVVRNEFEAGENSPFGVLLQRTMATAYLWHNYGKTTIGARTDIENVPIERLQAFYKRYYQPDNAVLLVAGKFDEPKTLALIDKYFSPIPRPSRVLDRFTPLSRPRTASDPSRCAASAIRRFVSAVYHVPSGAHEEFGAIDIISQVLADTPSGRLHKALVEARRRAPFSGLASSGASPRSRCSPPRCGRLRSTPPGTRSWRRSKGWGQRRRPRKKSSAHGLNCSRTSSWT